MKVTELRINVLRAIQENDESKTTAELLPLVKRPNDKPVYSYSLNRAVRSLISGGTLLEKEDGILVLTEYGRELLDMSQIRSEREPLLFVPARSKKH